MYEQLINPLKVRLMRKEISPEEARAELHAMATSDSYPVRLQNLVLEQLAWNEPSSLLKDSDTVALRQTVSRPSDRLRRGAMAAILDRIISHTAFKAADA
jgi:hypothetical protein